ncbi:hypothetical protein NDU88_008289 [Pleurodeles waltl]|uniref:Uncharacterized protein n=1 Tax=Pleurodeles waltl TaxID=8319 RepID=A0AAV7SVC6_PLEWA|nr:hypothetical protein NDU88_008289 [Pleurodeles waltl]
MRRSEVFRLGFLRVGTERQNQLRNGLKSPVGAVIILLRVEFLGESSQQPRLQSGDPGETALPLLQVILDVRVKRMSVPVSRKCAAVASGYADFYFRRHAPSEHKRHCRGMSFCLAPPLGCAPSGGSEEREPDHRRRERLLFNISPRESLLTGS